MNKVLMLAICLAFSITISAQSKWIDGSRKGSGEREVIKEVPRKFDAGFGMGLDYGGFGVKMGLVPFEYMSLFGALGYHLVDFGWQAGMTIYFLPKTNVNNIRPCIKAMYGTNRVIKIEGADHYNKNYKGLTIGLGCEIRFGKSKSSGFNLDLNIPIESQEFKDDYEAMENDPDIEITQDKLPIAFSIGYHFEL